MSLMIKTTSDTARHRLAYGPDAVTTSTHPDPGEVAEAYRIARDYQDQQQSDPIDWAQEAVVWAEETLEWAERVHGVAAEALALEED